MNERVRELALESGFQYESYKDIWYLEGLNPSCDSEFQRFAELIVQDCLRMADEFELEVNRSGLVDRMKNHFGV